jgi:hypothetical protein
MDRVLPAFPDFEFARRDNAHELVVDLEYAEDATRLSIDRGNESLSRGSRCYLQIEYQIIVHGDKILIP